MGLKGSEIPSESVPVVDLQPTGKGGVSINAPEVSQDVAAPSVDVAGEVPKVSFKVPAPDVEIVASSTDVGVSAPEVSTTAPDLSVTEPDVAAGASANTDEVDVVVPAVSADVKKSRVFNPIAALRRKMSSKSKAEVG